MGEYFRPLRRKLGLLTLVMACAFAAGWLRSHLESELFLFRDSFLLTSSNGWFAFSLKLSVGTTDQNGHTTARYFGINVPHTRTLIHRWPLPKDLTARFHLNGYPRIPYWSLVAPLTLLSAWLLLSEQKRQPPKPSAG